VVAALDDAIGSLELEVLTDPDITQPNQLYILTSEITLLRNYIQPIASLVNALRYHHSDPLPASTPGLSGKPPRILAPSTVEISPLANTYLGDVEDHCVLITSQLDQMSSAAENLTSLIFNMISAYQNESVKQLTLVTIVSVPHHDPNNLANECVVFPPPNLSYGLLWAKFCPDVVCTRELGRLLLVRRHPDHGGDIGISLPRKCDTLLHEAEELESHHTESQAQGRRRGECEIAMARRRPESQGI